MNDFSPTTLFDLSSFFHAKIFDGCEHAWEALTKICPYLGSIKLGNIESEIPSGVILINPEQITIERGCIIEPGCYIKGPCYIGRGTEVRFGAYIRGGVIIGVDSVVGHGSEVKNSIFLNRAHAAHLSYVGDSILGSDVNLGAGTKLANLKLNRAEISIKSRGLSMKTHLRKFGALMGDRAQTGCNSVTNPGTVMGKGSLSYPCTNISGFIPPYHLFNNEEKLVAISNGGIV